MSFSVKSHFSVVNQKRNPLRKHHRKQKPGARKRTISSIGASAKTMYACRPTGG